MGRTKWPTSKFGDIPKVVKLFTDAYNSFDYFGERLLNRYRKQLFGSGWTSKAIFEMEQTAIKRSCWNKDEMIAERVKAVGIHPEKVVKIVDGGLPKHHKGRIAQKKQAGPAYHRMKKCPICGLKKPSQYFRTLPATGMKVCPPCFKRITKGGK